MSCVSGNIKRANIPIRLQLFYNLLILKTNLSRTSVMIPWQCSCSQLQWLIRLQRNGINDSLRWVFGNREKNCYFSGWSAVFSTCTPMYLNNFRILYWFLDTIHEQTRETLKKGSNRLKVNSVNVEIRQKKAIINFLSVFTP